MPTFQETKLILDDAFPTGKGTYQDSVASRLTVYMNYLSKRSTNIRGSIIDVAGQYGAFLAVAERHLPHLVEMALTRYPLVGRERVFAPSGKEIRVVEFHCERDRLPLGDNSYDVAVFTEVLEHLLYDPVWTLMEINRVLRPGGILFLATPNAASIRAIRLILSGRNPARSIEYKPRRPFERHNRIYTSREVLDLLNTLGFDIADFTTGAGWKVRTVARVLRMVGIAGNGFPEHAGEETLVLAVKTRHMDVTAEHPKETRWPSWLYSPRPELCVRPSVFADSEDDAFPPPNNSSS